MAPNTTTTMARAKKIFSVAASIAASAMVARTVVKDFLPYEFQDYINTSLSSLSSRLSSDLTVIVDEFEGLAINEIFAAASVYLSGIASPRTKRLRVTKQEREPNMQVTVADGEVVVDVFEGVEFRWFLSTKETKSSRRVDYDDDRPRELKFFELTFHQKHKEVALSRYLPHVMEKSKAMKEQDKVIKIHMLRYERWTPANLDHPATFKTLAMDKDQKQMVIDDLERFVERKDYYRKVGKAWKRGYLLYGPPGTGKSSLIAAMANFLKFDVYDLELTEVSNNSELRSVLIETANRSILVVEDVDCSIELKNREEQNSNTTTTGKDNNQPNEAEEKVTLSGLLNFIDGLWSSCGDERIIVFTTNHRERLDPALLRPGRMDVHVHMSYCTFTGFKVLAENYHGIDEHGRFGEVERLIGEAEVTPADVSGELMKSDDVDVALRCVVGLLEEKKRGKEEKGKGKKEENRGGEKINVV